MAAPQYSMSQWTFQSLFPSVNHGFAVFVVKETKEAKEGAGVYGGRVYPKLLYGHKASWLLLSQLQVSSIWKSWRKRSLVFATFYLSHPSNASHFVSSLVLCHNLLSSGKDGASSLDERLCGSSRAMCAWRHFSLFLGGVPTAPVIVHFTFQQRCPIVWANTSLDVALKVFYRCD